MTHPRFEPTSLLSSQFSISSFIHHSTQNPPFPTLIHFLIHTDLMVNGWHRVKPLPRSHVPICLGDALIATCNLGRRHRHGLDREPDVWKPHFHFISFQLTITIALTISRGAVCQFSIPRFHRLGMQVCNNY